MGHSLQLKVLAEGMETAEQAAFLKELNCEEGQGYYYGRPMDAACFEAQMGRVFPWCSSLGPSTLDSLNGHSTVQCEIALNACNALRPRL